MDDPNFNKHMVVYFGSNMELLQEEFDQGKAEDKSNTVWFQSYDEDCA